MKYPRAFIKWLTLNDELCFACRWFDIDSYIFGDTQPICSKDQCYKKDHSVIFPRACHFFSLDPQCIWNGIKGWFCDLHDKIVKWGWKFWSKERILMKGRYWRVCLSPRFQNSLKDMMMEDKVLQQLELGGEINMHIEDDHEDFLQSLDEMGMHHEYQIFLLEQYRARRRNGEK